MNDVASVPTIRQAAIFDHSSPLASTRTRRTRARIRCSEFSVNHPSVVFRHLLALTADLDDDDAVAASFAGLITALEIAVPSYRGLQLTISSHGYPVVLTSFVDTTRALPGGGRAPIASDQVPIVSSLRLPLPLLGAVFEPGSQVVFYAGTRGALANLAGDLSYSLAAGRAIDTEGTDDPGQRGDTVISLDTDLPPDTKAAGISGLRELSIINRATGILIERGHPLAEVHDTLRRYAVAAQLSPHDFAVRLLEG
jgi:hypothetical protein